MKNAQIHLYTDGACKGNPGRGGYGIVMDSTEKKYSKEFSQGYQLTTNNRMELMAVIEGLKKLRHPHLRVLVFSDSKYVVDAVSKGWLFNWEKKGFNNKKNIDLWKSFLELYRTHDVCFLWVKGHAGHPQNERCDTLAVEACEGKNLLRDVIFEKELKK